VSHLWRSQQCRCQAGQGISNCLLEIQIFLVVTPLQEVDTYWCCEGSPCLHRRFWAVQDQCEKNSCLDCLILMMWWYYGPLRKVWQYSPRNVVTDRNAVLQPCCWLGWESRILLVLCDWEDMARLIWQMGREVGDLSDIPRSCGFLCWIGLLKSKINLNYI
jgi:hypothetical protein